MKTALTLLLCLIPAFAADVPADLSKALDTWKTAMLKGDAATLNRIYHDDLSYTHSSALVENKQEAIAAATRVGNLTKAIELRDTSARVYGNTALLRAKGNITSADGTLNKLELLMVWLKSGQSWQLVARQATKLP